ncbi:MAG: flavin reductase [Spirochaetia bacterium]|jgi:flavin reductase (DIM6/NTAB) family NADH-FMN oxidoreductase RutF|nr:flavin reductase [Spirochaetia bacterium]
MSFHEISTRAIAGNVFDRIEKTWMLVSAGTLDSWNTMTANWGGLGHLWNRDVAFVFVRPTRHTYEFIESSGSLTLSFFDESWRDALKICGKVSGRDSDKAALTGLKALEIKPGYIGFEQAQLTLACRVIHKQDIDPACFVDPSLEKHYNDDYHRLYVAEILATLAHA